MGHRAVQFKSFSVVLSKSCRRASWNIPDIIPDMAKILNEKIESCLCIYVSNQEFSYINLGVFSLNPIHVVANTVLPFLINKFEKSTLT